MTFNYETISAAEKDLGSMFNLETLEGQTFFEYLMRESRIRERDEDSVFPLVHPQMQVVRTWDEEDSQSFDRR